MERLSSKKSSAQATGLAKSQQEIGQSLTKISELEKSLVESHEATRRYRKASRQKVDAAINMEKAKEQADSELAEFAEAMKRQSAEVSDMKTSFASRDREIKALPRSCGDQVS